MTLKPLLFAGLLLLSGCAYDAGYYGDPYGGGYGDTAGYYDQGGYGAPYAGGGGVYYYDDYGYDPNPYWYNHNSGHHSGHHNSNGGNGDWNHSGGNGSGNNGHGGWCKPGTPNCPPKDYGAGNGHHGQNNGQNGPNWPKQSQNQPHQNQPHQNQGNWQNQGGQNQNRNNKPWIYQVPKNRNGSGAPAFQPNGNRGCGKSGVQPCN